MEACQFRSKFLSLGKMRILQPSTSPKILPKPLNLTRDFVIKSQLLQRETGTAADTRQSELSSYILYSFGPPSYAYYTLILKSRISLLESNAGRTILGAMNCPVIQVLKKNELHKLLNLIRSHLFIFAFISNILGGGSQRILL